jgi:hypothetical protein
MPPQLFSQSRLERALGPLERLLSLGMAVSSALRSRIMLRRRRALESTLAERAPTTRDA